jgi:pimeloyl-ACP methyl ester carboxylesterase
LRAIRDYLSARPEPKDFAQAARALRATHGDAFPALADRDWADMADAMFRKINGRIVPDYDPALVEPLKVMDFNQPLPDLWQQFVVLAATPMLVVRGETSRLLSQETAEEMVRRCGSGAELVIAPGQGHAPVLHVGKARDAVARFVNRY